MPLGGFAFPAPEPPALLLRPGEGPHLQQYKGPVPARHRPGTALTPRENADRDGGFDPKTRDYLGEDGTDYFEGIDLDDEAGLRTRYRQLAQKSHPDMGGSNRAMADINRQYGMRKSYLDGRAAGAKAAAGAPAYGWDEAASSADPRGGSGTDLMLPGGRWPVQPNVVPTGPSLSGMGGMGAVTGGPQTTSPTGMLPATQADGTGDAGKSTTIDTDPATHTPEQMATIRAYQAATDKNILAFIERWHKLKDPNYRRKVRISIASVNQRTVMDVKAVTGVDTSDFTGHSLSGNALEHTALRHGVNGKADHSMADPNDIARMGYVLEHYDSVEALLTKDGKPILSGEYYNADGSRAPLVRFAKRVNGTYYVVEAVPDAAIREFRVVTAYMQKGSDSTSQELDVPKSGPQPTSKTGLDAHTIASGISIPQPPSVVNPGSTADTPSGRVALLSRDAQSSFGPMGQMALSGVYDQDMAARLDPDAAHLVFAKVYNAVMQGQQVPSLPGVPRVLIDAAAAGARSDLRLSRHGGAEASSGQQTLLQLAREMAPDPKQSGGWDALYRLAHEMGQDPGNPLGDMSNEEVIALLDQITPAADGVDGMGFTMSANDGILSKIDQYAIDQYKRSGVAYPLNAILRGEAPMTEEMKAIAHDIDQALLKLPTYQGTVYRSLTSSMMVDADKFWERYKPGEFVPEPSYVSSSTEVYDEAMDIQMIITSKRGCDMRAYNPLEQEVLFKRGTLFFVEKREGNTIWLTEL